MPGTGGNINGPSLIRVPAWVRNKLGAYYLYFAHHSGRHIRLAYADIITGPWKLYAPGTVAVEHTAFYRPQPDPDPSPALLYTHVASPEIVIEEKQKRFIMFFHGIWTNGQRWPAGTYDGYAWAHQQGYGQFTQAAVSTDGLHWKVLPEITREPYLRVIPFENGFLGMARTNHLLRAAALTEPFTLGPNPFIDTRYDGRVRHVALMLRGRTLHVFFTAVGDAPEHILHTTISLEGEWTMWRTGRIQHILQPERQYECSALPNIASEKGEIDGPANQMRDPAIFADNGNLYLLYTVCGEQGIAIAELHLPSSSEPSASRR
jgi:hypothetical protein